MTNTQTLFMASSALAFLSACGGGSTIEAPTPTAPSYETLGSTAATTSKLGGVALLTTQLGAIEIVPTSGTMTHNTGNTTITDGTYSLTDEDGFSSNGSTLTLTDGTSTITSDTESLSGTYDYLMPYSQAYPSTSGVGSVGVGGIIGVTTSVNDVPTTGSATYTGDAEGIYTTLISPDAVASEAFVGTSTVSVDFADGTVDATMTDLLVNVVEPTTNVVTTTPTALVDTISVTGMNIDGNSPKYEFEIGRERGHDFPVGETIGERDRWAGE